MASCSLSPSLDLSLSSFSFRVVGVFRGYGFLVCICRRK
jgi:hypothetical protein